MLPSQLQTLSVSQPKCQTPPTSVSAVHTIYVCTYADSIAQIRQVVEATHMHTHTYLNHRVAQHISTAAYPISRARSVRICVQQRCHHLWPGLVRCGMMQRQLAVLRKRRQRTTSARHTGRQADALLHLGCDMWHVSICMRMNHKICMYLNVCI